MSVKYFIFVFAKQKETINDIYIRHTSDYRPRHPEITGIVPFNSPYCQFQGLHKRGNRRLGFMRRQHRTLERLLAKNDFIGALDRQGNIIGFSSMDCNGHLHSMFVHKNWQGCGVATQLLSEVEKVAQKYGVDKIHSEVSITARSFFEQHGYRTMKEQKQKANQLFLTNYKMEKVLK